MNTVDVWSFTYLALQNWPLSDVFETRRNVSSILSFESDSEFSLSNLDEVNEYLIRYATVYFISRFVESLFMTARITSAVKNENNETILTVGWKSCPIRHIEDEALFRYIDSSRLNWGYIADDIQIYMNWIFIREKVFPRIDTMIEQMKLKKNLASDDIARLLILELRKKHFFHWQTIEFSSSNDPTSNSYYIIDRFIKISSQT